MPEKEVVDRAKEDLKEGKSPSTAAGEFVHEEIEHVKEGKHGARSPQQAIAIGLSKARRAGIPLAPPSPGKTKKSTRVSAERDYRKGQAGTTRKVSAKRSRATEAALKKEPRSTVSHKALSAHAKKAAKARRARVTTRICEFSPAGTAQEWSRRPTGPNLENGVLTQAG